MLPTIAVSLIFAVACAATIYLILRRPYLYIRVGSRALKIESYFFGALLGPLLIVVFGLLNYGQIAEGLQGHQRLNPLGILVLFLSMVFMSMFLDITGFFAYCARMALKFAGSDGRRLFLSLYLTVSFLTIFTSNDIIVLTFTPFVYYFAKNAGIDPKPYLIAEFFAANTWSMMLYIGNPTNILLAAAFGMKFGEYTLWMLLPTIAAGVVNFILLYWLFHKEIKNTIALDGKIKPADAITDKMGAIIGVASLAACVAALSIAPYFGIEMWIVSLAFALMLAGVLIVRDSSVAVARKSISKMPLSVGNTMSRMPWTVVPFVLSLFITVEALRIYGVADGAGAFFSRICGDSPVANVFAYGVASTVSANLLNNIPMTLAFTYMIQGASGALSNASVFAAGLATVVGSNLGANLTPIGALAGIMWMSILKGKDFRLSFLEFVKYGLLITPITLLACLGVLAAEFLIF